MGCKQFFDDNRRIISDDYSQKKTTRDRLIQNQDFLKWENEIASEYSPGTVELDEIVCRQIHTPIHYNEENKEITPTAFSDVETFGLSCNRLIHTSIKNIAVAGIRKASRDRRIKKNNQKLIALINFLSDDLRQIRDEGGNRAFVIFDTALQNDISHCDIFTILTKQGYRSVRSKLFDLAKNNTKLCLR